MNHLFKTVIDFNSLINLGLTPNEYIYLYLKYHKLTQIDLEWNYECDYESLEERGWINILPDGMALRPRAINLFEESNIDIKFYEFWGTYPLKVPNDNGGYRPLRAKEITASQAVKIKKIYTSLIKKEPGLHDKVISGLKSYIKTYRNKMAFLVNIEKFLDEKMWELYEEDVNSSEDKFSINV
jgi:hypothetical protein